MTLDEAAAAFADDEFLAQFEYNLAVRAFRQGAQWQKEQDLEMVRVAGTAMFAALDVVRAQIGGFANWPDALKTAFTDAIIDRSPLTEAEIKHTQELAKRLGWELEKGSTAATDQG